MKPTVDRLCKDPVPVARCYKELRETQMQLYSLLILPCTSCLSAGEEAISKTSNASCQILSFLFSSPDNSLELQF